MIRGSLFTRFYLEDGIRGTPAYQALAGAAAGGFAETSRKLWDGLAQMARPSEAETEAEFIYPMLDCLGWTNLPQQEPGRGRRDIADALLFLDEAAKAQARAERQSARRFRFGTVVVENEARETALDRASGSHEAPSSQILRYLRRAESESEGAVRWGLLTNGRFWRLYWAQARSRAEGFVEIELPALLGEMPPIVPEGAPGDHWLRVFLLIFRRDAFRPEGVAGRTFLDDALAEGRRYEQRITATLSRVVFDEVFPALVSAIIREAPGADLAQARDAALRLLYRLLFLLYAEDRDLLPVGAEGYRPYSLRGLREEAARAADEHRPLSSRQRIWWQRLDALFGAIAAGDAAMGLPPYNGGLFDSSGLLSAIALPDSVLAPLLDAMSREGEPGARRWINYRDLSVQQLGSIYERLLEQDPAPDGAGGVMLRPNAFARKTSGSYYTPDELVQLILRRAVGPLLAERRDAFRAEAGRLASDRRPLPDKLARLERLDPAEGIVSLRILDPAMGSGHFLVSLVDYLSDAALLAIAEAPGLVAWAETEPYRSPLARRVEALRARIREEAAAQGWPVRDDQLDDRHLVRRIVLKRVVYGVDLNPMAVELAKLSLWLHSFTVGAPLSFLDHHLRCGDSLFGEFVGPVERHLQAEFGFFVNQAVVSARMSATGMAQVENLADADIGEVHTSAEAFQGVEEATAGLRAFFDLYHAGRWLPPASPAEEAGRGILFGGNYGDVVAIALGAPLRELSEDAASIQRRGRAAPIPAADARLATAQFVDNARALAGRRRFLHWEAAFPGVWDEWEQLSPPGGFHAVIGNPPYVRQEGLIEQKPILATSYTAYDGAADLYVYFVERALSLLRPGGRLAFVLTNKWLKAAYAEKLRTLLAEHAWVEDVTDFGHARGFFADADVMPCIATIRRPDPALDAPEQATVAAIPSADVGYGGLEAQIGAVRFALPRARLGRDAWVLEPPEVLALLDKLERAGRPLREYVGHAPHYGIKTGLNEAFVVDQATRDRLVAEDPRSETLIRPFLRGQDVGRWVAEWAGEWMIFARHGTRIEDYPAVLRHLEAFRTRLEPRPAEWRPTAAQRTWPGRKPGSYDWFEIQDNVAYWQAFARPKIVYQVIQFHPSYCLDRGGHLSNDKTFFLPSDDPWLLACLNAPLTWWRNWRRLPHLKDEALSPMGFLMEQAPIPEPPAAMEEVSSAVEALIAARHEAAEARRSLALWYRHEWGIERPPGALLDPFTLAADAFTAAVRGALPARNRRLSAAALSTIAREHAQTVAPLARRLRHTATKEHRLARLVENAYGLTSTEIALMWETAPPRMPGRIRPNADAQD